jgi:hypothetical protein
VLNGVGYGRDVAFVSTSLHRSTDASTTRTFAVSYTFKCASTTPVSTEHTLHEHFRTVIGLASKTSPQHSSGFDWVRDGEAAGFHNDRPPFSLSGTPGSSLSPPASWEAVHTRGKIPHRDTPPESGVLSARRARRAPAPCTCMPGSIVK